MVVEDVDSAALRSTMSSCASYLTSVPQFPHLLNGLNEELTYIKSPEQNSALHKIRTAPGLAWPDPSPNPGPYLTSSLSTCPCDRNGLFLDIPSHSPWLVLLRACIP